MNYSGWCWRRPGQGKPPESPMADTGGPAAPTGRAVGCCGAALPHGDPKHRHPHVPLLPRVFEWGWHRAAGGCSHYPPPPVLGASRLQEVFGLGILLEINCVVDSQALKCPNISTWAARDRLPSHPSSCWLQGRVRHWRRVCFAAGIFFFSPNYARAYTKTNKPWDSEVPAWLRQAGATAGPRG